MEPGANTTYVRYHVGRARGSVSLELKVLVNYRDYHGTTHGDGWLMDVAPVRHGLRVTAFDGARPLLLLAEGAEARIAHTWHHNFDLARERERGLDAVDDHLHAGTFRAALESGGVLTLVLSAEAAPSLDGAEAWRRRERHEKRVVGAWKRARPEAQDALPRARGDRPLASRGHALRDQGGSRRRAARGGGAWRPADLDGREGGRVGGDPADRQTGRDQRPLVQRARRDGRVRPSARKAGGAVGGAGRAGEGGVRAVLERARRVLFRRDRRARRKRRRPQAEPDLRGVAPREPAPAGAPAEGRRRVRPASPHVVRPAQPGSRALAVPGPLRRRPARARRRVPPGHGLGVASRPVRPGAREGLPRHGGGAFVPGAARGSPRRLWRRLHRRDLRRRSAVRARRMHRSGVERRGDAPGLARPRPGLAALGRANLPSPTSCLQG